MARIVERFNLTKWLAQEAAREKLIQAGYRGQAPYIAFLFFRLITPVVTEADTKSLSAIATSMKDLAGRAREGKLKPEEYQGGTASLSNMGMYGIKQFEAVINPPQGMIMAIGAGEKRPYVIDDSLQIASVMSATGSFDHRAIDGADGARLMQAFKRLVESPLGMLA